jgi:cyclic beta-1,2-glucan synthetase
MYRVALESVLGFSWSGGDTIVMDPCVPDEWPSFTIDLRGADGTRTTVRATNPSGCAASVVSATFDGEPVAPDGRTCRVRVPRDGAAHTLDIVLGRESA